MAGQYRFKDTNGNVVAQISASAGGTISFSGSQVDFSQANTISLGEVQLAGTASNALLLDGYDSLSFTFTSSIHPFTSSVNTFTASISGTNTFTASTSARLNALESTSASVDTLNNNQNTRLSNLENKTGSLATTGSNTFIGTQVFTGSVYITSDLIVQGSSSLQNITASAVSIGTNKVILNTDNPAVRYGGISVIDSGSSGLTGSILWDSTNNNWLYQNPSASSYVSAKFISGPQSQTLGSEPGLVTNFIQKAVGDDHISSSAIYDDGSTISLKSNTEISGSLKVTGSLSIQSGSLSIYNSQSIFFNDSTDNNWKIYRFLTASFTKSLATGSTLNINAHYGVGEGFAIGGNSGVSYYEIQGSTTSPIHFFRGNVGIGTSASYPLTIYASSTQTSIGLLSGYSNTSARNWGIASNALTYGDFNLIQSNTQGGEPFSAGTSRLYISGSGNIGIGTITPTQKLTVNGTIESLTDSGGEGGQLNLRGTTYQYNIDNYSGTAMRIFRENDGTGGGGIILMYISASGNIGIGNATPQATLHLGASLNTLPSATSIAVAGDTSIRFTGGSDGNSNYGSYIAGTQYDGVRALSLGSRQGAGDVLAMTIREGKVGIGTTNPGYKLDVYTTGGTSAIRINSEASQNSQIRLEEAGTVKFATTYVPSDSSVRMYFAGAGSDLLNFKGSGVGIGTTNPGGYKLYTQGDIAMSGNNFYQGGTTTVCIAGTISGNQAASWTINCTSQSSLRITAVMNHYGYIYDYGCQRMSLVANGPVFTEINVSNTTSANGGSWSFTQIDSTRISINKNAGSYGGGGLYFIEIVGNNPWY